MSLVTISAELPNVDSVIRAVNDAQNGSGLQYTAQAVRQSVELVQSTWIKYASGAEVTYSGGTFHINVVSGQYLRSLQNAPRFLDDLTGEVFSDSPYGEWLEKGTQPRDMKAKLLMSGKAKVGKNGSTYITIPFRHGAPGAKTMQAMPASIYDQAKKLTYNFREGNLGAPKKYIWGGRLPNSNVGQQSHIAPHPGAGYTWKTGMYSGMVRAGRPGHSQYLTFRRISTNSDPRSWMFPGTPPKPIREAVVENTREEILQNIRQGFEMDLYFMTQGGGGQ